MCCHIDVTVSQDIQDRKRQDIQDNLFLAKTNYPEYPAACDPVYLVKTTSKRRNCNTEARRDLLSH